MIKECNCSFNWVEVDKFTNSCTYHNTKFDINSKCPFYKKPEFKTPSFPMQISNNALCEKSSDFISKSQVNTSKSKEEHILKRKYVRKNTDSIVQRFHNYGVKFEAMVKWDHLFKYEEVRLNKHVSYKRIDFNNAIVKVFKKSILVTLRSSKDIVGLDVESAEFKAKSLINEVLDKLPKCVVVSNRDVVNTHNAFINDPLAKALPDNSKVYINNELRYINDKSKGMVEGEFVSKKWAIPDSKEYQQDLTALIDRGISRDFIASALNELIKDRYFHAENMRSHVEAIQTLSSTVKELKDEVKSIAHQNIRSEEHTTSISILPPTISKYDVERKEKIKRFIEEFK